MAIISQPELAHAVSQEDEENARVNASAAVAQAGATIDIGGNGVHPSHDLRRFEGAEGVILYCDVCGRWQKHNAHRSKLGGQCEPIKEGTKSDRKLLRHKIVPGKGAKLPAHIKTRGGKRC